MRITPGEGVFTCIRTGISQVKGVFTCIRTGNFHIRELKRILNEDSSKFGLEFGVNLNHFP